MLCRFWLQCSRTLRRRNVSDKSYREKQNTLLCSVTFSSKIVPFIRHCGKLWQIRIGYGGQCHTSHAHCMLGNKGYKYTLGICNTYCFSTATIFARTLFIATFKRASPVFFLCWMHTNTFFLWHCFEFYLIYIRTCSFTWNFNDFVGHLCGSVRVDWMI